jgi:hypothetical protein
LLALSADFSYLYPGFNCLTMKKITIHLQVPVYMTLLFFCCIISCGDNKKETKTTSLPGKIESLFEPETSDEYSPENALLVIPANPGPGENFRILATGGKEIRKAKIVVNGPSGNPESGKSKTGDELPCWRIDDFQGATPGAYTASLVIDRKTVCSVDFKIGQKPTAPPTNGVWKTQKGWDNKLETIYSAWVNALYQGFGEDASWPALHTLAQDKEHNFLYNFLSLNEDDPQSKNHVIMEPDCADNPFFLRAYFSWKLGLPFGFHICDRGYLGSSPHTGQWITNESSSSKGNPVLSFNSFIRVIMNGVHSGTARTALDNENSDYYPVSLTREGLRPGTVYADPYGHTLIIVSWKPQSKDHPGLLLATDAQPDKTIAVKRFWKGNFLFNTSEVVGEPGFKAFRPIQFENGKLTPKRNESLTASAGYAPFSMQQKKMEPEAFYRTMERLINPKPLDPEDALLDLVKALHEQLLVRVKSVGNGEEYMKSHPGTIIPMPTSANGIFLAGGAWEDYSTPNRDLRLLIAIDAVLGLPARVVSFPGDYSISKLSSPNEIQKKLQKLLEEKIGELSITYTRSDGSEQKLTLKEILGRKDAFEVAYNPNDGVEIRWGAPVGSAERSTCKRQAPAGQQKTMEAVRQWFHKRLHPPT